MAALFDWLQLDIPAVASGEADAFGDLLLRRDQPARLTLASDLTGVALALPAPWGKTAAEPRSLAVDLRLARERIAVDLALGTGLRGASISPTAPSAAAWRPCTYTAALGCR